MTFLQHPRSRLVAGLLAAGLFVATSALAQEAAPVRAAATAEKISLTVTISGVRPGEGTVNVGLYDPRTTFPKIGAELAMRAVKATGPTVTVRFDGVARGRYALAAFQDLNGNGQLDVRLGGIPAEPVAFSRDARAMFRAPTFEEAAFDFAASTTEKLAF